MRPVDRENMIYTTKLGCPIDMEEKVMFDLLKEYCPKGSKVLDIGCGSGEITLEISKLGYKTEGVDFSPIAIEKAKNNGIECRVIDVDAGLPYEDNQFDAVWMGDVIEHVFDPVFVLKEINRVREIMGMDIISEQEVPANAGDIQQFLIDKGIDIGSYGKDWKFGNDTAKAVGEYIQWPNREIETVEDFRLTLQEMGFDLKFL